MSKARITYRFENTRPTNGQASAEAKKPEPAQHTNSVHSAPAQNVIPLRHLEFEVSEKPVVIEEKPPRSTETPVRSAEPEYPYDYGAWSRTPDAETDALEKIIRSSSPHEREAEDDDLDAEIGHWRREERLPRAGMAMERRRTPEGPAWWKVAGSVIGAIATGVLFGTFMLNFFTGEGTSTPGGTNNIPAASEQPSGSGAAPSLDTKSDPPPGGGAAAEQPEPSTSSTSTVDLPERRMFLLQNGMFESLESARALAADMKSKGLAATIEEGERFYVYAGVTSDRDAALRAGLKLQAAGVEVYVKPYELPPVQQVLWSEGSADAFTGYITKGSQLVQMIGDLTLVHLDGDAAVAPEKATMSKLTAEHLALSEWSTRVSEGLPSQALPMLGRMDDAVRNAIVAMEEYAAHPDHAYLWSAQSALMDYIIAEKLLLTTIAML